LKEGFKIADLQFIDNHFIYSRGLVMKLRHIFSVFLFFPVVLFAQGRPPIIDVHLHASGAADQGPPPLAMCTPIADFPAWDPAKSSYGQVFMGIFKNPPCKDPVWSPKTDEALLSETIAVMKKLNVIGVLSGTADQVATWRKRAPERFIPGLAFQLGEDKISPEDLRALNKEGRLAVFGEITNQYAGIAPDDPRMDPYWKVAQELDVPVGIHIGTGPPGVIYLGNSQYRARLHSALTMEEVLVKYPKLRVYIMHAGYPKLDDMLAVLYAHPQVYVDVGVIVYTQPPAAFYAYLKSIVDAGFGKRIMFGSDQMVWPGVIERSIKVIEKAPFLSETQKRDILYNNAARFLRFTPEEIARHHQLK
jgi:predicted TIM-barrel fold metal-dependent hydrolase